MSTLLDITGDDIALLSDSDLRTLVGMLCEADFRRANLPVSGILWSGDQNARDGGLDVVVKGDVYPQDSGFILRSDTGFQVKKPGMSKSEIIEEMRPNGELRGTIKDLISKNGSYIIVSSSANLAAETMLKDRLDGMKEAISSEQDHENLRIDFYDRGRLATWVRSHPSIILWVREKIGRAIEGWYPYGRWTSSPSQEKYIIDDTIRVIDGTKKKDSNGLSVAAGLSRLREILSVAGTSVRLAGLSGVGKTRFVQALFEPDDGQDALDPSLAFYTDASKNASPRSKAMIEQLIAANARAIVIVDNCPPDLHRELTGACTKTESTVSVITIEYDVRDDLPDETSVFRLQPASETVVLKLIRERFPHISQTDAETIAEFAGGNARLAISLAKTLGIDETLSGLRDEDLFARLFQQRNAPSDDLLNSAMALSLVYSFNGVDTASNESELNLLGSIIGKVADTLYADVDKIMKRELIQTRDIWRAVLPHAVANNLAKRALDAFPKNKIVQTFLTSGSERVIKSFSRRLSYLHDAPKAQEIAKEWLSHDGYIGAHIGNLSDFGLAVLNNIASILPLVALDAIERAANAENGALFTSRENRQFAEYVRLLRHLAYEDTLFSRAANLICRFALTESPTENQDSVHETLKSLFFIYLSGTHATLETRKKYIERLVFDSSNHAEQELGLSLLDAALETGHFSSHHTFQFGARSRDFGYQPRKREELVKWFETFTSLCVRAALSDSFIADKAKNVLRNHFRGLWVRVGEHEFLENGIKAIHARSAWNEGWIAVRETIKFDANGLSSDVQQRLRSLEETLRPSDLLQQARAYALSDRHFSFGLDDLDDDAADGYKKTEEKTRTIGAQAIQDKAVFQNLLPDLLSTSCQRIFSFGKGLADGAEDKLSVWNELKEQLRNTAPDKRSIGVLLGFLLGCSETATDISDEILDALVTDAVLAEHFPRFQTIVPIDQKGVERLHKALELGKAPIGYFQYIAWGRSHESINDQDLAGLLDRITEVNDGIYVAIEILSMRFHEVKESDPPPAESLSAISRKVLSEITFSEREGRRDSLDHELGRLCRICLKGEGGTETAIRLSKHFLEAVADNRTYTFHYPDLLASLAKTQPKAFLSIFLEGNDLKEHQRNRLFSDDFDREDNPINQIPDEIVLAWCEENPATRYTLVAAAIQPFSKDRESQQYRWNPIVSSLFEKTPNIDRLLEDLADSIRPSGWMGSLSEILESRLVLFTQYSDYENPAISSWARRSHENLVETIRREKEWEEKNERERSQSFE